jgi:hypothetical protein
LAQLPEWQNKLRQIDQIALNNNQLEQVLDAEFIVMEMINQLPEKRRGVLDENGKL